MGFEYAELIPTPVLSETKLLLLCTFEAFCAMTVYSQKAMMQALLFYPLSLVLKYVHCNVLSSFSK